MSETQKKKQLTSSCKNCRDSGYRIVQRIINGLSYDTAVECECGILNYQKNRAKELLASMPSALKDLKINDYSTDIYTDEKDKILAKKARAIVVNYINSYDEFKDSSKGLYFYSSQKGSGKTRLATSIGNALMTREKEEVKFASTLQVLREIKNTFDNKDLSSEKYMAFIKNVDVLILDDIGVERPTGFVNDIFYEIINKRLEENKITIFTSNCKIEELSLDERIKSRIYAMVFQVKCPEEDIRKKLTDVENRKLEVKLGL